MRKLIIGACVLSALIFVAECAFIFDGLWGQHAWERWKAQREAKGDVYTFDKLVPPQVPDDENFAMAPIVAGAIRGKGVDPRWQVILNAKEPPSDSAPWKTGQRLEREAWAKTLGGGTVRQGLAAYDASLDALVEASKRPTSRLPITYERQEVPALLGFRKAIRLLRLRALTKLDEGDSGGALSDTLACFRVANHFSHEPSLIASLLCLACTSIAMQPVWEGLNGHRWNDQQLQELETRLSELSPMASLRRGFAGERIFPVEMFTNLAEGKPAPEWFDGAASGWGHAPGFPLKSEIYWNLLNADRYNATIFLDSMDPRAHRVYPELANQYATWYSGRFNPHTFAARLTVLDLATQVVRGARYEAALDEARVACALERYRLAHGSYPDSLNALVPAFMDHLPHDLVTGGLLHYQSAGESYTLYENGWDGKDDGGVIAKDTGNRNLEDPNHGDWVWPTARP